MVNIAEELDGMADCCKKRAGVLVVKAMADYFLTCQKLNELKADGDYANPHTIAKHSELYGRAECLEELVPELFEVYEDTPRLQES